MHKARPFTGRGVMRRDPAPAFAARRRMTVRRAADGAKLKQREDAGPYAPYMRPTELRVWYLSRRQLRETTASVPWHGLARRATANITRAAGMASKTSLHAPPSSPTRCPWTGIADPEYARYHDEEWGVPLTDSRLLFEKLILEGFQSGLSWLTILKKRDNFRRAFDDFDAEKIATYGERDIARLMADAGIVRNRLKIESSIDNAKAYLAISKAQPFAQFIWGLAEKRAAAAKRKTFADVPAQTEQSVLISKRLKAEGFRFVGPTTVYAFMQSSGMVNDHLVTCHRHSVCAKLQRDLKVPRR